MKLTVYNTLSREKEEFKPIDESNVRMYSCWPTVYSMPHLWNMRSMFTAWLIRDVLRHILKYHVTAVSNFTDVGHMVWDSDSWEDKMEKWSKKEGLNARELAEKYEKIFIEYFKWMNIPLFDIMPKATEHIKEQIEMVQELVDKWFTYTIPWDGIYMDTSLIEDYWKLLGKNYKEHLKWLNAWERVDFGGKRNTTDFALWKFSPTDQKRQMEWDSPWWIGFPGWHIECSAMSRKYLGKHFDIHHWGMDLIPVHHTNEIAQSECCDWEKPWVNYWIHHQFVNMYGKKMSKSDGNYISPEELLEKGYTLLDIKYWFFSTHYRNFLDFTWENINAAKSARAGLRKVLSQHELKYDFNNVEKSELYKEFCDALCDDFNTSKVLSILFKAVKELDDEKLEVISYLEENVLRFWLFEKEGESSCEIPEEITELANQRLQAKQEKNYALADELRAKIQAEGFAIKDVPWGFEITKA